MFVRRVVPAALDARGSALAQVLLSRPGAGADVWDEIQRVAAVFADSDGTRWLDVPFEALLRVGDSLALTDAIARARPKMLRRLVATTTRRARVVQTKSRRLSTSSWRRPLSSPSLGVGPRSG